MKVKVQNPLCFFLLDSNRLHYYHYYKSQFVRLQRIENVYETNGLMKGNCYVDIMGKLKDNIFLRIKLVKLGVNIL